MCNNCKWELRKSATGELIGLYNSREEAQNAAVKTVHEPTIGRWLSTTCFSVEYGETPQTANFHISYAANIARIKQIMG
jgi:hypothetical protein